MVDPGMIVIVNGTSGSGKSTTCEKFARASNDFWLLYGIDHFLAGTFPSKFGHHGPRAEEGFQAIPQDPDQQDGPMRWRFGEHGMQAFATMHEWIASASRTGCNIVFDHILMTDPPVVPDLAWRLEGLPTLLVTLKPPIEVLEQRVAEREMTKKMPAELGDDAAARIIDRLNRLRPWFYEEVYANTVCDLEIDSSAHSIDEVVAKIAARVAEGPGDAFERLRQLHPRP